MAKATETQEAVITHKTEAIEHDREGVCHAFAEADRECEAQRAHATELEQQGVCLEEQHGALAEAETAIAARKGTVVEAKRRVVASLAIVD